MLSVHGLDSFLKYHILDIPDRVAQLAEHWARIPNVVCLIPAVVRHIFQFARCGRSLR